MTGESQIVTYAKTAAESADAQREQIMNAIQAAATGASTKLDMTTAGATGIAATLEGIDIAQGAGALLLDDALQKLSSVEQTAAQTLAAARRGQKEVKQAMG